MNKTTLLEEFSRTKIERALNSFTYLFSDSYHKDIPVALFWSLSGLEALYVEGDTGITQQLNDKIQVFLGEIETDKKRLKKLYNFRSSLIHGGMSIPIKDAIINDEKHLDNLYEMNTFAIIILVTSLQKIIKNNLTELKFKYTY
ncbi:HEPN domain-containing protein [Flavobacterium nitratireducens]|uniref:HEPN domain-containing protein n=1 Tax=Flavobacterium nitratireducens TaxID=992289 RepID=UPI002414DE6D|nr:HEPN domain-containing protein [Flavobacterium nitratireducens]